MFEYFQTVSASTPARPGGSSGWGLPDEFIWGLLVLGGCMILMGLVGRSRGMRTFVVLGAAALVAFFVLAKRSGLIAW